MVAFFTKKMGEISTELIKFKDMYKVQRYYPKEIISKNRIKAAH
jgi:hypothetical protein